MIFNVLGILKIVIIKFIKFRIYDFEPSSLCRSNDICMQL